MDHPYVECSKDEMNDYEYYSNIRGLYRKRASSWKKFQEKAPSIHLYKNTRTIWHHGYWTKYDRKIMNKRSRYNVKIDLKKVMKLHMKDIKDNEYKNSI